ncbi:hypothetical protein TrRE_jg281, partial [Triparma retinervis]
MSNDALKKELTERGITAKGSKNKLAKLLRDDILEEAASANDESLDKPLDPSFSP